MIDISQIVSSAANAVEGARRATADATASGFGDALSRARESNKAPAPPARETAARDQPASRQPAAQADAGKPRQAAAAGKKPAAGPKDEDKDQDDTAAATPTDAAAAAAAALALMLPAAAPASPAAAPAGTSGSALAGVADTGGAAALQAALANATQSATADVQADAMPAATTPRPDTLQVVTTEARPAQPSVADTLATIASQRAAMQAGASTGTDGKAAATQAIPGDGIAAQQQDTTGQSAGGSGNRPDSGIAGHRADPLAANPGTADARPAATPFAVAQAAARTGEASAASPDNTQAVAAALAGQATPSATAAAAAASARPVVAPQLNDSQWPQALGQQMIRMSTQGQQSAELQLNPPTWGRSRSCSTWSTTRPRPSLSRPTRPCVPRWKRRCRTCAPRCRKAASSWGKLQWAPMALPARRATGTGSNNRRRGTDGDRPVLAPVRWRRLSQRPRPAQRLVPCECLGVARSIPLPDHGLRGAR